MLETTFEAKGGEARVLDFYVLPENPQGHPHRNLVRIVEGVSGYVELDMKIAPRFDYGSIKPWLRQEA